MSSDYKGPRPKLQDIHWLKLVVSVAFGYASTRVSATRFEQDECLDVRIKRSHGVGLSYWTRHRIPIALVSAHDTKRVLTELLPNPQQAEVLLAEAEILHPLDGS